jgi:hypothetical protein
VPYKPPRIPLFDGVVIAVGFPVAEHKRGFGLELSIDVLAGLSGARHIVEYDGGVLMKGYSHLFVPVKKSADSMQWHVITSPKVDRRVKYEDTSCSNHLACSYQTSTLHLQC